MRNRYKAVLCAIKKSWLMSLWLLISVIIASAVIVHYYVGSALTLLVACIAGIIWITITTIIMILIWIADERRHRAEKAWIREQDKARKRADHRT